MARDRMDSERLSPLDPRSVFVTALAVAIALVVGVVAQGLSALIALITNLAFHQKLGTHEASPLGHGLGPLVILLPALGGLIVGLMARYGSKAIRGHGIPEAMEQVLFNDSRIPARMTFLKPLSAAISIGTGGPFGAEGPIIATGSAFGSLLGQVIRVTADERKTLLAAGAAAGMAATFGSPVSAVLLAIELLLFEYRARSVIPVALAASAATSVRMSFVGSEPVFPLPEVTNPSAVALCVYVALGILVGFAAVGVTRLVYWIEDSFEKIPLHWMWWPTLGGLVVGFVGWLAPRTLGVGYANIEDALRGNLAGVALLVLCVCKLASWAISLGSGTSGGTLAPLLTIGAALGGLVTGAFAHFFPDHAIDPRIGALVGMASMFAGASRALLASVVFAFECTRQPIGLLPLLGGGTAAYLVSCLAMQNSIMTEKLARRGARVTSEYQADFLDGLLVRDYATCPAVTLDASMTLMDLARLFDRQGPSHQGYPVVERDALIGVITRRGLLEALRESAPSTRLGALDHADVVSVYPDQSLRDAADRMVTADVGRVVVVAREDATRVVGILTRSDIIAAHGRRIVARDHRVRVRKPSLHALRVRRPEPTPETP